MIDVTTLTILLVEDSESDAVLFLRAFNRLQPPPAVHVVSTRDEAIEYLEGAGRFVDRSRFPIPSLLLLDMHLAGKTGDEVLEWLRRNDGESPLLVVMLTGSSLPGPPKLMEHFAAVTIFNSPFLKPITVEMAKTIVSLYDQWNGCRTSRRDPSESTESS